LKLMKIHVKILKRKQMRCIINVYAWKMLEETKYDITTILILNLVQDNFNKSRAKKIYRWETKWVKYCKSP